MRRTIIVFAAGLLALALIPSLATAQTPSPTPTAPYPPTQPTCLADRSTASPGTTVTITGDGWEPSSPVDIDFHQTGPTFNRDLGGAQANAAGTFVTNATVPSGAHNGAAVIVLSGTDQAGNPASCSMNLTIKGGPARDACAEISDDVVTRGQVVVVFSAAGCWEAGTTNRLFFRSEPVFLGSAVVAPNGSFSVRVQIPEDALIGHHVVRVRGTDASGAEAVEDIPVLVVSSVGGGGGDGTAGTGLAIWGFLALAVALLGSGTTLLAAARTLPIDTEHPAVRQERHRQMVRATAAIMGGTLTLTLWMVVAALHPGDPGGLSIRHPLSVGTLLLVLAAAWAARRAVRGDPPIPD